MSGVVRTLVETLVCLWTLMIFLGLALAAWDWLHEPPKPPPRRAQPLPPEVFECFTEPQHEPGHMVGDRAFVMAQRKRARGRVQ